MRTRKLGFSDLELTVIGLGTWAIGGSWEFGWGPQDESNSIKTIIEAIEQGINWIDTAPIYGCGDSERAVGKALKEIGSEKPIIATKCGLRWNDKREKYSVLARDSITRECEESLSRLDIEVIDLIQIHWPQPDEQIEEAVEALARCVEQGKIRYVGVSNFSIGQMERARSVHPIASLQPHYSMLHRKAEEELFGYCDENDIGIVCYSPMQKGLLTGKVTREWVENLPEDDHRHKDPDFHEPKLSRNLKFVEAVEASANRNGITPAQLALAWVLRRSEVTAAIAGARRPGQITETAKAGDIELSTDDIDELEKAYKDIFGG